LLAHWIFNEFLPGFGTKERERLLSRRRRRAFVVVVVVVDMMLELRI
jgi:hypothetical protein